VGRRRRAAWGDLSIGHGLLMPLNATRAYRVG
jgi:hypothetical protein